MGLQPTWMPGNVPFGSRSGRRGMLGQEGPGAQAWLAGSWNCVLLPAFRPPDLAAPGKGHVPGALGVSLDLDSLKAKKFFLGSDESSLLSACFNSKQLLGFHIFFLFFSSHKRITQTTSYIKPKSTSLLLELLCVAGGGAGLPHCQAQPPLDIKPWGTLGTV